MVTSSVIIFILGLCVGSFLNVLIARLDRRGGIVSGRSECPLCKTELRWSELIPILSFLLLRGQCRTCRKKISYIYPAVEIVTALFFLLFFIKFVDQDPILLLINLLVISIFVALIFFDYLYFIIPDKLLLALLPLALTAVLVFDRQNFSSSLLNGLALSGFFGIMYLVSRGAWLGLGDVKLAFLIGFFLGYPLGFFAVVLGIWAAALFGLVLLLLKKATPKTALPFGSFLSAASLLIIIYQNEIQKIISGYFF